MKQKDIEKINSHFQKWRGSNASFNSYADDHDRFTLALERADHPGEFIGISFLQCLFVMGVTRWSQCNLECVALPLSDGSIGFEIRDADIGFLLRCGGPVVVGNSELIVPQD